MTSAKRIPQVSFCRFALLSFEKHDKDAPRNMQERCFSFSYHIRSDRRGQVRKREGETMCRQRLFLLPQSLGLKSINYGIEIFTVSFLRHFPTSSSSGSWKDGDRSDRIT
jgi:hypothetical protein